MTVVQRDGEPQLGWPLRVRGPGFRYGWDFSAKNCGGAQGLFRSSMVNCLVLPPAVLRGVARNIRVLEQIASTVEWLRSFWNARVDPVSAIPNVKVNVGYEPFVSIDYIVNKVR